MTTFETAKVGDRVWCILYGWHPIIDTQYDVNYPILTSKGSYTIDGRNYSNNGRTLFWDEVVITPPPKPLPKLEVDTKVLVWDEGFYKTKAYFSHFDSKNKICVFPLGRTSWSNDSNTQSWTYWELTKD